MQNFRFDYLDDGQISASVSLWRDRLREDGDGVLSVCRSLAEWEETMEAPLACATRIAEILQSLLRAIGGALEDLPRPTGIFASEGDKKRSYGVTCRFLLRLERSQKELRREDGYLSSLLPKIGEKRISRLRAKGELMAILEAAKAENRADVCAFCQRSFLFVEEQMASNEEDLRQIEALQGHLRTWCNDAVGAFFGRVSALADLEHEGAGASPMRLSELFGELRHTAEQTIEKINTYVRRS